MCQEACKHTDQIPCVEGHSVCYNITDIFVYRLNKYHQLVPCRQGEHLQNCEEFECNNMFKCPNFYCIPCHMSVMVCGIVQMAMMDLPNKTVLQIEFVLISLNVGILRHAFILVMFVMATKVVMKVMMNCYVKFIKYFVHQYVAA